MKIAGRSRHLHDYWQADNAMSGRAPATEPTVSRTREIAGVTLHLSTPDTTDQSWIGQDAILRQLLACWLVVDARDLPLTPRILEASKILQLQLIDHVITGSPLRAGAAISATEN